MSELRDGAYLAWPDLLVFDCDRILEQLAQELPTYTGAPNNKSFLLWATEFVGAEAERYRIGYTLLRENRHLIAAAVRRALKTSALDHGVQYEDVLNEVHALIFAKALDLCQPGSAKITSRLTALSRRHVHGYHVRNRKRRLQLIEQNPELVAASGCETLSELEMQEIQGQTEDFSAT